MKKEDTKTGTYVKHHNNVAAYYKNTTKAVILSELTFWNDYKIKNNELRHNLPLVFYSAQLMTDKFKFPTVRTFTRCLKSLVEDGILFACIANKMKRDITFSYLVNVAKYEAIKSGIEYPEAENLRFLDVCNKAYKDNEFNSNTKIVSEVLPFLLSQNVQAISQNVQAIAPKATKKDKLLSQNVQAISQNVQTLPINTSSNTKKELINYSEQELNIIELTTNLFKQEFTDIKDSIISNVHLDSKMLEMYLNIEDDLRRYKQSKNESDNIVQDETIKAVKAIFKAISERVKGSEYRKFGYFYKCILNEPIDSHITTTKKQKIDSLLKHLSERGLAEYYLGVQKSGEKYAIATLNRYLIAKGKIKEKVIID